MPTEFHLICSITKPTIASKFHQTLHGEQTSINNPIDGRYQAEMQWTKVPKKYLRIYVCICRYFNQQNISSEEMQGSLSALQVVEHVAGQVSLMDLPCMDKNNTIQGN